MKKYDVDVSRDIMGYRELRCILDDDEGKRILEIRGTLPKEENWLNNENCGSTGIDITYLSPEYSRDDILIGLAFYMSWAAETDCTWAELTLSDPRCLVISEEIRELLQADRLSTPDHILVRLDREAEARFDRVI